MVGVVGSSPIVPTKIFEKGIWFQVPFLLSHKKFKLLSGAIRLACAQIPLLFIST